MARKKDTNPIAPLERFPFPLEWIKSNPQKVEEALSRMSIPEQVRCVQSLRGKDQMDLLILSSQADQVARLLPEEDIFFSGEGNRRGRRSPDSGDHIRKAVTVPV